jgi:uncharacterized iron-regulated protein
MSSRAFPLLRALAACCLIPTLLIASGCAATRSGSRDPASKTLVIVDGRSGAALGWSDVVARASEADAVFVGERHDDPTAHAVQLAVFQDLLARYPGTAIALEHLERDEQQTVESYLRGEVTPDRFIDSTESRNWAGKDTWVGFWQPLVDTAREKDAPVIAANAPRDIVRRAREEGHDALDKLSNPERATFEIPLVHGPDADWDRRWEAYFERFREFMCGDDRSEEEVARARRTFLSQSMWDGTMGASAAAALANGAPKVVVCAGCFHIERDGGTVLQFLARRPGSRALAVTVIDESSDGLRDEDRGAADVVIYGFPVKRKQKGDSVD